MSEPDETRGESGHTNAPWIAEFELSEELAASIIDEQFPYLAPAELTPFGEGWDNTAFIVNRKYVFRFPRREMGAEAMELELAVLPQLGDRLLLSIPELAYIGSSSERFPWRFSGYLRLPGETVCQLDWSDSQRCQAAPKLAAFLRELHSIGESEAMQMGADFDRIERTAIPKRTQRAMESLEQVDALGFATRPSLIRDGLKSIERDPPTTAGENGRPRVLVHGDLYVRHLLADRDGCLSGVIDWGDVHCGDPAIDLAIAITFFPPPAREIFVAEYGGAAEAAWRMAMMRAIQHTLVLIPFAADTKDERLLNSARQSLARIEALLMEGVS